MFSFASTSKPTAACHAGQRALFMSRKRSSVACSALVLKPIGDGSSDHLGGNVKGAEKITLSNGLFEIGRQDVDIIINVPSVSSRHAMLRVDDERITVTDLRSTNGTYLDGNEITPMQAYEVMPGNTLIFGDEHLAMFEVVVEPDAPPAAPAEASPEQSA